MGRGARREVVRDGAAADRDATDGDAVHQLDRAVEARGGGAGEVSGDAFQSFKRLTVVTVSVIIRV